jgi:hypothetical protein
VRIEGGGISDPETDLISVANQAGTVANLSHTGLSSLSSIALAPRDGDVYRCLAVISRCL